MSAKLSSALALVLTLAAGSAGAAPASRSAKRTPKAAAGAKPGIAASQPRAASGRKAPLKAATKPAPPSKAPKVVKSGPLVSAPVGAKVSPATKLPLAAKPPAARPEPSLTKAEPPPAKPRPRENPYLEVPDRAFAESTLAFRYANLSDDDAMSELRRRAIAWVPATPPLPGVRTPIRLMGSLHGVSIHSTLPPAARVTSAFEILDARLALSLDDFTALLEKHDIVEIVHYTMYRPPAELSPDPTKQIRHPAGLAIDVGAFKKRDGRWLAVGPHWPSAIGQKTCGEGAREHWAPEARELVSIVCEAMDQRIFHFMLTPDFDAAHADHVHLEIKPATRWFIVN